MPSVIQKQAQVVAKFLRNMFHGDRVFENPKDHEVLMRLIKYVTRPEDLILDSFAGSGSTAHAVLQLNKESASQRRFILIEMDETIFAQVALRRLRSAIGGYSYKDSKGRTVDVAGLGGGAQCCHLGESLFDEHGQIRQDVRFADLAAHVFFVETGVPLPKRKNGRTPLLGVHNGVAVYLLFNGILGDKTPQGGNVLTRAVLELLPPHDGPKVVFGTGCRIGPERLKREGVQNRMKPEYYDKDYKGELPKE